MKSVCFYFQIHQPYRLRTYRFFDIGRRHDYFDEYQNRYILNKVAEKSYLPANNLMLDLINKFGDKFRIAYSISGIALEQFEQYNPEVLESFRKLAQTGQVEFLSETYAHSLSALKSKEEFVKQVEAHRKKIKELFNYTPVTFRNTELVYSDEIGAMVADMGYKTMLTEGAKHVLGWKSPNYLYTNSINPKLKLLLKNYVLSDDIAFRFSDKSWQSWPLTAEKFTSWIKNLPEEEEVINLFMDYETFGEHQWKETGIFDFLKALPEAIAKEKDICFTTPAEISKKLQPISALNVPHPISWADEERDLTAWLGNELQDEAFDKLYDLEQKIKVCSPAIQSDWQKLQTSDHFYYMCTKWFSDGAVHHYFNPYNTPYEAFINYMNVLSDFIRRVEKEAEGKAFAEQKPVVQETETIIPKKTGNKPQAFDDLKRAPKAILKKALRNVPAQTMALALKNTDKELKERLIGSMGKKALKQVEDLKISKAANTDKKKARQKVLDAVLAFYAEN